MDLIFADSIWGVPKFFHLFLLLFLVTTIYHQKKRKTPPPPKKRQTKSTLMWANTKEFILKERNSTDFITQFWLLKAVFVWPVYLCCVCSEWTILLDIPNNTHLLQKTFSDGSSCLLKCPGSLHELQKESKQFKSY